MQKLINDRLNSIIKKQSPKKYRMMCPKCGLSTPNARQLVYDEDDALNYQLKCSPGFEPECIHIPELCDGRLIPSVWTGQMDKDDKEVYEFDLLAVPSAQAESGFIVGAALWQPDRAAFHFVPEYGHHYVFASMAKIGYIIGSVFDCPDAVAKELEIVRLSLQGLVNRHDKRCLSCANVSKERYCNETCQAEFENRL